MKILNISFIIFLVVVFASCTKDFEEINTNNNFPETTTPDLLFRNILYQTADDYARRGWEVGSHLGQQMTYHDFNDLDRYDRLSDSELWNNSYAMLRDLNNIESFIELNPSAYNVYKGPVKVMKAFIGSTLTDLWGNVPFFAASQGKNGQYSPAYDAQEEIYNSENGIIDLLVDAVTDMESYNGGQSLGGDIIYGGDLSLWVRFANSLRMRQLIRSANQQDVSSQLKEIIDGGKFIANNDQNAKVDYLATSPNEWYFFNARSGDYTLLLMTDVMGSTLMDIDDPRLEVMFRPNTSGEYQGLLSGIDESWKEANNFDANNFNLVGSRYRDFPDQHDAMLLNTSEVHFMIAEAIERGWVSGDASALYEAGIAAGFEYLGVTMPTDYMSKPRVEYGNDNINKIITQKWIANFAVGFEPFFDHRRTGYPTLSPAIANVNEDRFPIRFLYPSAEQALNKQNYDANIAVQGMDNINTNIWLTK